MFSLPLPPEGCRLLLTPQWAGLPLGLQVFLHILVCILPLTLVVWLYTHEMRLVPPITAVGLLALRVVVALLVLFLVCWQPMYQHTQTTGLPGRVLIAVDRSDSMNVADPQRPPAEKLRLARALHLVRDLAPDEQLDAWIAALKTKSEPQWVKDDEARDAGRRWEIEQQRRDLFRRVCDRVDEKLTRTETARRVLDDDGLGLWSKLAAKHGVEVIGFHGAAWDADDSAALFARRAGSTATDLRLPLTRALERPGDGRKVFGVVVLTDGRHNAGDPPVKKAVELGERQLPIYPIALGSETPPVDLSLIAVKAPTAIYKDDAASVGVRFRVTGLGKQDVNVELFRGVGPDRKLVEKRTVHHDGADSHEYLENFSLKMDEAGTQTLTAVVSPADPAVKEAVTDNNARSAVVNVAKDTVRVLLIDGEARWEYHYLASALERDPTVKVESVVFDQPRLEKTRTPDDLEKMRLPKQALPAGDDALADYDCIVLGDVSPAQLPPADRVRLEKYVGERGGALVVVAGKRSMPLAFPEAEAAGEADPLRKLLPVEAPRVVRPADGFPTSLTAEGRETKFMEMDDDPAKNQERWAGFPLAYWGVVGKAKPAASTLAFVADAGATLKEPSEREKNSALFAWQHYGLGRVLFIGTDATWRWRFRAGDVYHHRFWGQVMRWAAERPLDSGNDFVRFGTSQPTYTQGKDAEIVVRFKPNLNALKEDVQAEAQILRKGGDGKPVASATLTRRAAQPNAFEARVAGLPEGEYEVVLKSDALADKLTAPAGTPEAGKPLRAPFTVTPGDNDEMLDLSVNRTLLNELAARSGGKVYTAEDAEELLRMLTSQSVQHVEHDELALWRWWVVLVVVVGLLTVEWVTRKWSGLP
jgi:hypothetical protein